MFISFQSEHCADIQGWTRKDSGTAEIVVFAKATDSLEMSFIIWLSADIVQLGDNGRNAPYVGLRRAESYLLPEGKCVRHVHICQPTFLSPQFFHLSTILTWGEELLRCSPRDRTASDKLITIYRAPTYTAHPFEVSACGVKTVSGDTLSCTHVTNNREGC